MEIHTYDLKNKVEELKDLPENTLMAIAELCMDYYKLGQYSVQEEVDSDKQDEIDELQNENDELQDELHSTELSIDNLEDLIKDCYSFKSIQEVKEEIEKFANIHCYNYSWNWLNKDKN